MADLILHHYPNSPFSEKVRLMFGFKQLAWQSVLIPVIMPKPDVVALTGGYRRTPFLQIGADIYCDSALIGEVLERIAPTPPLYPVQSAGLARTLAQWADSTLFWTAIAYAFQPAGLQSMFANVPPEHAKAFGADRAAMRGNAPRLSAAEATANLTDYLDRLENMLADERPFLLGAAATIADFSVVHSIWYVRRVQSIASILERAPKLLAWADRMAAIGHGTFGKMTSVEALQLADSSTPAALDATFVHLSDVAPGDRVTVTPTDYALDPVEGELVQASASMLSLRRTDERAGTVIVHFPRIGYQLKKIAV
ncbi:glutathione S-transferase [Actimicrobium sp. GrIS 1.19]|uniref:glutathione S-transferase family protein n=1 Tax=Actimicrobium sp. GrIS 1.19 TaxID=3071708 RepID=UPI002DFF939A|nr:glutathione S-transferase [Actimicrobium sp. GrIS 1.19]